MFNLSVSDSLYVAHHGIPWYTQTDPTSQQCIRFLGNWNQNALRNSFWDCYWGRAGQLLANFFPLSLVTVPEVFAKVNSTQFSSRF